MEKLTKANTRYSRLKAEGKCPRCREPHDTKTVLCGSCRNTVNELYKQENYKQVRRSNRSGEKYKARKAAHRYKVSKVEIEQLLQITQCSICSEPATDIDHDHKTGKLRGRLCGHCNKGLGHFRDSTTLLEKAKNYLQTT